MASRRSGLLCGPGPLADVRAVQPGAQLPWILNLPRSGWTTRRSVRAKAGVRGWDRAVHPRIESRRLGPAGM